MNRLPSRAEPLAWVALVVVLVLGIGWGIDAQFPWDVDNIAPGSVLKGMAAGFGPGWYSSYGPLPYYLTAAFYLPVLAAAKLTGQLSNPVATYPWGFENPELWMGALVVVARLVPLLMALGLAASLIGRERGTRWAASGWLPLALLAGSPAFVYYARTSNVDLQALFWAGIGFAAAERVRASARGLAIAAAAAVAAICTKEQMAPFSVAILGLACVRAWTSADTAAAGARRVAFVALVAVAVYALLWQVPWNARGWAAHHEFIFNDARYDRTYALTPSGIWDLALACVRQAPIAFGWAVIAGTLFGLVVRAPFRDLAARGLGCALYLASFVVTIGYVYPRFLLPFLLLLVPYAWRGWYEALWILRERRALRAVPVAALATFTLLGGPVLDAATLADARYRVEAWMSGLRDGAAVEVLGNPHFQARVPRRLTRVRTSADSLLETPRPPRGDAVLVSAYDSAPGIVQRDSMLRVLYWNPLITAPPGGRYQARTFASSAWSRWVSGLPVDPEITVFTRVSAAAGAAPAP